MSEDQLKTKIPHLPDSKVGLKDSLEFLKEYEFEHIQRIF